MKTAGLLSISFLFIVLSCKKESFITSADARVTISSDTLKYDTVFTSFGSITQFLTLRNDNKQRLRISSIRLMGGNSSAFKINADGSPGPLISNLELAPGDSTYIFVNVSISQTTANLPFVLQDSIAISYNGTERWVQLEAWGQNAHFLRDKVITANETWNNDLPYVILGSFHVRENNTLTINKGCRIYVHANAPLIIDGTLEVNGEKDTADRVYFIGDRLDEPYKDFPAGWPGMFFTASSKDNTLRYAVIRNAYQAIAVQGIPANANPKISLQECIIDNAYDAGIVSLHSSINARNCLISNCGKNLLLAQGGDYQFTHCTVVSYSNSYILHRDPVLLLTNYIVIDNSPVAADLRADFSNCIFWGENGLVDDEVVVGRSGNTVFNVSFDHILWKLVNTPADVSIAQVIYNHPPLFDSINTSKHYYSFRLKEGSPALEAGSASAIAIDLDGAPRPVGLPDLGCFEKQ
ncbi:MAG: hypothetical protein GC171_13665 [Terrimonas sp.]|nr:hypothetical protein [Terrimonas sp.]